MSLCLTNQSSGHEGVHGSGDIAPTFLIQALDGDDWSASRPGRFTPVETVPDTHCIEGHRADLDAVKKRKIS
jgi:hypothetical protein